MDINWRFELTQFKIVRDILKSRWFPLLLIIFNLAMFTVVLLTAFLGGFSAGNYNFGVMMVWILWWVMLMFVLVPGFSRSWCMMCPFPIFGDMVQRGGNLVSIQTGEKSAMDMHKKSFGLNLKWPMKLRNMWLMNIGFLITTFFSPFMTVRPLATFILLAGVITTAIIIGIFYEKRSFCRYVCPVSGFQGLYSQFAAAEVRVINSDICEKHVPKTCTVGNEKGYGCPWMQLPFSQKKNTYCGFCFECFKSCPNDNMAFSLRTPGADLLVNEHGERGFDEAWKAFIMLGIALVFSVSYQGPWAWIKNIAHATSLHDWLIFISIHSTICLFIIPAIFFGFSALSKWMSGSKETPLRKIFLNFSYVFIPIGLGVWIAFSFGIILPNGSYILHILSDPFAWGWDILGTANFPWTPLFTKFMGYLQGIALIVSYLFAIAYGFRLSKQTFPTQKEAIRGWIPILLCITLSMIGFLFLFIG